MSGNLCALAADMFGVLWTNDYCHSRGSLLFVYLDFFEEIAQFIFCNQTATGKNNLNLGIGDGRLWNKIGSP